jgi:acetate kinase
VTDPAAQVVLCVNGGSSTMKCAVYRVGDAEERLGASSVDGSGVPALGAALDALGPAQRDVTAIGYRVVHGGPHRDQPARVDDRLLSDLRAAVPFAPLHLPATLDVMEALIGRHPGLPQVACFDTAFHRTMPESAWRLPVPSALVDAGVRRYGFHGLSYEYVVGAVGADTLGRAVLAHLGSGASLAAVRDGRSVHTTMGFTPTGGVVMSSRSGDLDPGVLVYLARELGYDADRLERLVDQEAGLLALSGTSGDMRTLLDRRGAGDDRAALAVEVFTTRVRMQIGAYAALLDGLDAVVFTGGIGAHAASVRAEACAGLEPLGVSVDAGRNAAHDPIVSPPGAPVTVRVVETDEDLVIARHTRAVLAA